MVGKKETQDGSDDAVRNIDLKSRYNNNSNGSDITGSDRLLFAKQILLFLFIIVIVVFISSYIALFIFHDKEEVVSLVNTILDITKTVIPSTATLVLGFYFGKKDS